jgi:Ca-activated chloride channel homolog
MDGLLGPVQGERMMPKALFVLMMVGVVLPASGQSDRSLLREGNRHYGDSKFSDAEVSYKKALEANKEYRDGNFNLGDALYRQQRFGEAAEQYQAAASRTKDPFGKAQALHNLGNALLKEQKLQESIDSYKEALRLNPNDADTKYNLEYAKMLLKQQEEQKKQKQDQKQNQKDKKDQQKQDQQKKDEQKKDDEKKDPQKQDQQQKDQQKQDQQKEQQAQQKKQQISKKDAERILEALKNEEKDVQKKLHKKVPARVRVEKDW